MKELLEVAAIRVKLNTNYNWINKHEVNIQKKKKKISWLNKKILFEFPPYYVMIIKNSRKDNEMVLGNLPEKKKNSIKKRIAVVTLNCQS